MIYCETTEEAAIFCAILAQKGVAFRCHHEMADHWTIEIVR